MPNKDQDLKAKVDNKLDQALKDSFPASDPVSFVEPQPVKKGDRTLPDVEAAERVRKAPPEPANPELGHTGEERNRHLRYAHEQYSGSGQGRFGAPKGRSLPLEKPQANRGDYPPGSRMPWPPDAAATEQARPKRPRRRR